MCQLHLPKYKDSQSKDSQLQGCCCGISSINITWEFVRTENLWAPISRLTELKIWGEVQQSQFLTSPLGDSDTGSKLRTTNVNANI